MSELKLTSTSAAQTEAIGRSMARVLSAGDVVALNGELGAGKTQLARGITEGLGGDGRAVSSPTFVLMQEYAADPPVVHIDAYRMASADEVETLGWDVRTIAESVSLIEWADRIDDELRYRTADVIGGPGQPLRVTLEHAGTDRRELTIDLPEDRRASLRAKLVEIAGIGHACATCKRPALPNDAFFPFCSERCKTIDLGNWLGGNYRISREVDWENDDPASMEPDADESA